MKFKFKKMEHKKHLKSCPWSDPRAFEGPDTCYCWRQKQHMKKSNSKCIIL